ncbi:MAG: DNA repair protein RecO [Solobacterium sp.]|nr:DNA repair protein RecO [Solobacterium sp.]
MNERIHGFVLKQSEYKEHSVLLTVMSEEFGKISFTASGVRKMTSKNAGSILPYTKGEFLFDFKEGKTLFRLKTAHTLELYRNMRSDLTLSAAAGVIAELADIMNPEIGAGSTAQLSYKMMDSAFKLLNEGRRPSLVIALYLAGLLNEAGLAPDVDECVSCGSLQVSAVSVQEGGFLCGACAAATHTPLSTVRFLRSFRLVNKAGFEHFDTIEPLIEDDHEILKLLIAFLRRHGGFEIRSYALYNQFLTIE